MDDSYQSFIILEQKEFAYYLSKFVVSIEARGKGIAMDLWEYVDSLNIPVFWKTKKRILFISGTKRFLMV
jgi:hypothetical protein